MTHGSIGFADESSDTELTPNSESLPPGPVSELARSLTVVNRVCTNVSHYLFAIEAPSDGILIVSEKADLVW
jgi:hypothetical protein